MPVPFTCPHCGAQTSVAGQFAGHSGPCAQCGNVVKIPVGGGARSAGQSGGASIAVLIIVVLVVFGVIVAGVSWMAAPGPAHRGLCLNNMKQIGLSMIIHQETTGCFPSPDGSPQPDGEKVSWRVTVLPHLEYRAEFDTYNLEEPWDSPDNLAWAESMPGIYRCRGADNPPETETNYVALVGPETAMPRGQPIGLGEITDGASYTILAVGIRDSGIPWSEPRDLDATTIRYRINHPAGGGFQTTHDTGMTAGFCDGSVQSLSPEIDPTVLRALTTRAGNELVRPDVFDR